MKKTIKGRKLKMYTNAEDELMKKYYTDFGPTSLAVLFKEQGFDRDVRSIQNRARRLDLKYTGPLKGGFKKGHVPNNKGKKMTDEQRAKSKHTFFKKGHISANHTFVGDIRKRKRKNRFKSDGSPQRYSWIKIAEPKKWELLHRYIWKKNKGAIPKGKIIIFKDDNPDNCVIENLEMISRSTAVRRNYDVEKVKRSWDNPSDKQVLSRLRVKDPNLKEAIMKRPDLIDLARKRIILNREIKNQLQNE